MLCIRNETCHKDELFCCYSCEIICSAKNDCNDDECKYNPNCTENKKEQDTKQKDDIKWILEQLLNAGRYTEVDFDKIEEIARRNGYEIDEELDLVEIEKVEKK